MFKVLILGFILCIASVLAAPRSYDENAARQYILDTNDSIVFDMNSIVKSVLELADLAVSIIDENGEIVESKAFSSYFKILRITMGMLPRINDLKSIVEEAYKFPVEKFKDTKVKIGIQRMKTLISIVALGDDFIEWTNNDFDDKVLHDLKKRYCKYNSYLSDCPYKFYELEKLIYESNDPKEILHYWNEWRNGIPDDVESIMETFIRLQRKLAEKMKQNPTFIWFSYFLEENFGDQMENVINDISPLFEQLHAYIRNRLHEEYGDVVPKDGLIPHHLYEEARLQAWKPDGVVAKEFYGTNSPIKINFTETTHEAMELGSEFMESLGMEQLEKNYVVPYNMDHLKEKFGLCDWEVSNVGNQVYLAYCSDMNNHKFFDWHDMMAQVYYHHEEKALPFVYTYPFGLDYAAGRAVRLSATTPKYISKIGHGGPGTFTKDDDMNRLFRKGLKGLLALHEHFIHVKVVTDVLVGKVEIENMNDYYWELLEKYAGVRAPNPRPEGAFDFPQEFYEEILHNHQAIEFAAEIMGYQIYEGLCKKSGEYVAGDSIKVLHNCNFYGNKKAGSAFKEMMKLGATKPMNELLEVVTADNRGMNADALLNYYAPLRRWLEKRNAENKVKVGF